MTGYIYVQVLIAGIPHIILYDLYSYIQPVGVRRAAEGPALLRELIDDLAVMLPAARLSPPSDHGRITAAAWIKGSSHASVMASAPGSAKGALGVTVARRE